MTSEKLATGLEPRCPLTLTWWGNATISIDSTDSAIVIDPYLFPTENRYHYIFCTHEHYDHAYPENIRNLIKGPAFRKIILARSCLYPSNLFYARQLDFLDLDDYIIFYPKYYDRSKPRTFINPNETVLDQWHVEGVEMVGEDPSVTFPVKGPMPQMGYLIGDLNSGISFYHPGDLCWTYPELGRLKQMVDIFFLPTAKLSLEEAAKALELFEPRVVIPIHWRYEGEDYIIPKLYKDDEPPDQQILGHHFPTPEDPQAYNQELATIATDRDIKVLPLRTGVVYEV